MFLFSWLSGGLVAISGFFDTVFKEEKKHISVDELSNVHEMVEDYQGNEQEQKMLDGILQFGNTEVYLNEELNLIPKLDEIENLGLDYIKLEFTFEDNDKIKEILDSIEKRSGQYKAYNFESGLY